MAHHEREIIGVDDRVSVGRAIPLGIQHMMSMFGSTVLVPVLTGLNPNVAIMCSGIGTICYLLVTREAFTRRCRALWWQDWCFSPRLASSSS